MACVRDSGTTANALHDDISVRRPHAFLSSTCRVLIVMCIYGYVELLPPLILTLTFRENARPPLCLVRPSVDSLSRVLTVLRKLIP